uniref:Mitogen-activated protein kinase n=1 Tax=Rhizophora mucronata TaxID=61149 RepID=A0A2P2LPY0_RHIMU
MYICFHPKLDGLLKRVILEIFDYGRNLATTIIMVFVSAASLLV